MGNVIDLIRYKATIEADDKKFSSGMDNAGSKVEKLKGKTSKLTKFLKVSLVAGLAAAGASLVAMGKKSMETADKFDKMSQRTQMSTDRLQELDYIASQNGTSMDVLEKSMNKMNKSMGDAMNGSKKQADAFSKLGVSITDTNGNMRDSGQVWDETMKKLQGMENESERNALAMDLMGKNAIDMAPMLNMSGDAMDDMAQKAHDMGMVMGEDSISAGVQLTDTIDTMKRSLGGMANQLGAKVLPLVNTFLQGVLQYMPQISNVVGSVFGVIGRVISMAIGIIKGLINTFEEMATSNGDSFNKIRDKITSTLLVVKQFISTFIAVATQIWKKYGTDIMAVISFAFNNIKTIINAALIIVTNIIKIFTAFMKGDFEGLKNALITIVKTIWRTIKSVFSNYIEGLKGILKIAASAFLRLAKHIMGMLWDGFKSVWKSIKGWFGDSFTSIVDKIEGFKEDFKTAGEDIIGKLWDGIKEKWKDLKGWFSDSITWLKDKLTFWDNGKEKMNKRDVESSSRSSSYSYRGYSVPQYDVGTPFVPSDQLALIHKGEAIIPAKYNPFKNNRSKLSNSGSKNSSVQSNTYHIAKVEFPNVRNQQDIENAFSNLPLKARQIVTSRG